MGHTICICQSKTWANKQAVSVKKENGSKSRRHTSLDKGNQKSWIGRHRDVSKQEFLLEELGLNQTSNQEHLQPALQRHLLRASKDNCWPFLYVFQLDCWQVSGGRKLTTQQLRYECGYMIVNRVKATLFLPQNDASQILCRMLQSKCIIDDRQVWICIVWLVLPETCEDWSVLQMPCLIGAGYQARRDLFNLVWLSIADTQQASPISSMLGFEKRMKYFKACINMYQL